MTTVTAHRSSTAAGLLGLLYGVVVYACFLVTFVFAVAFVENASLTVEGTELVPRTLERGGPQTGSLVAVVVNLLLLSLFAVQHSVMARRGFKTWWSRLVPAPIERSTYVLAATACLAVLMLWWHPMTVTLWHVGTPWLRSTLIGISLVGWLFVLASTFLISHTDLFGLRQVLAAARGRSLPPYRFVTPLWYRVVRHPLYLGFLVAFWVTPTMSVGHLLFAAATTGYILVGLRLEERDLVAAFGDDYRAYRSRVPALIPRRRAG